MEEKISCEQPWVNHLPQNEDYEKSYAHRDQITHILVVPATGFVVTGSANGELWIWKKIEVGIELVKTFKIYSIPFAFIKVTSDGLYLAACSRDRSIAWIDMVNFDLMGIVPVQIVPKVIEWIDRTSDFCRYHLLIADTGSRNMYLYDLWNSQTLGPLECPNPPTCIGYNRRDDFVVVVDEKGMIHYWKVSETRLTFPSNVHFKLLSETDLYLLIKNATRAANISFSIQFELFGLDCLDGCVRIFHTLTGKLYRQYRQVGVNMGPVVFDISGLFVLFPGRRGIRVVSLKTNRTVKMFGLNHSFSRLALFQQEMDNCDPILFCNTSKTNQLYLFSNRGFSGHVEFKDIDYSGSRPAAIPVAKYSPGLIPRNESRTQAIIYTDYGDIWIELWPHIAPLAVENFVHLSQTGYYDSGMFHRVIRGFMIQTGDPEGNGGQSMWNRVFDDEIVPDIKHDHPYRVSMANRGPHTNGSQFFITTVSCPWLDGKHTIFGKVVRGMDVVHAIERVPVHSKHYKPLKDVKIINIHMI